MLKLFYSSVDWPLVKDRKIGCGAVGKLKISNICDKVFKKGPSKICGRQPLKNLKWYGMPKQTISLQIF